MMCVERLQRVLMALLIIASVGGIHSGFFYYEASALLVFMAVMMLIWAFTNFCPSIWLFKKFLPECKFGKKSE